MSLLQTRQLTKLFGAHRAVDGVDFTVRAGELLALIGSNGAGKTTLVNLISGLLTPDAGAIVFAGRDVTRRSVHERIAAVHPSIAAAMRHVDPSTEPRLERILSEIRTHGKRVAAAARSG